MAFSSSRRRSILVVVAALVVGLAIADLAFRGYVTFVRHHMPVVPSKVGRFDANLGWSLEPGSRTVSYRIGEIEYRVNSKGLRDDEHAYEKPAGKTRIVIVGDSMTFGFGVPIEKHFTRLLEGYCKNTEVINLGVSGFGVDQELLFLQGEGMKYEPDLVIAYVAHYGNNRHMHTSRFGREKPKFKLTDKLVLTNHPVPPPQSENIAAMLFRLVEGIPRLFSEGGQPVDNRTDREKDHADRRDPQFRAELNRLGQAIVHEMKRTANSANAEFLLITPVRQLADYGRQNGFHVLDPEEALQNRMYRLPEGLGHLNEAGNGVLAWEITKAIRRLRLLEC